MIRVGMTARLLCVGLLVSVCAVGCGGGKKQFTPEEFSKVKKDMPQAQVIEILGKPTEDVEAMGVRRLFWESNGKYYSISFTDGKVNEPMAHANKEDYMLMLGLMQMGKDQKK